MGETETTKENSTPSSTTEQQNEPAVSPTINKEEQRSHNVEKSPPTPAANITIGNWDERLLHSSENLSLIAENFRKLRTEITHPESGQRIRSVMVTSSMAAEGKSFICANLGISIAKSVGRHALLVDSDLRRPTLPNLFGLNPERGLSDYLINNNDIPELINQTGLERLNILPAGPTPRNPAELLTSDKMSAMLDELTQRYDDRLIILDSPPFHAATETLVLSQLVDKVILVVRWRKSGKESIKKMVDLIGRDKIAGVVFNAFEMNIIERKVQAFGYNSYYSDAYY